MLFGGATGDKDARQHRQGRNGSGIAGRNLRPRGDGRSAPHRGVTRGLADWSLLRWGLPVTGRPPGDLETPDPALCRGNCGGGEQDSQEKRNYPHELISSISRRLALAADTAGLQNCIWMEDRYPLTIAQLRQAKEDLAAMKTQAEEIARLMSAGYGPSDPKSVRADELNAAIQRLMWELERSGITLSDVTSA